MERCWCFALPSLRSLRIFSCLLTFQDSSPLTHLLIFTIFPLIHKVYLHILDDNLLLITHYTYLYPASDFWWFFYTEDFTLMCSYFINILNTVLCIHWDLFKNPSICCHLWKVIKSKVLLFCVCCEVGILSPSKITKYTSTIYWIFPSNYKATCFSRVSFFPPINLYLRWYDHTVSTKAKECVLASDEVAPLSCPGILTGMTPNI